VPACNRAVHDQADAVTAFEKDLLAGTLRTRTGQKWRNPVNVTDARQDLAGKDLVCACPLDEPCHADVLIRWANT
jgi:hypothetical protein